MQYAGSGDRVISVAKPATGMIVADVTHVGGSNFIVWSSDAAGTDRELLVNTIGNYSGRVAIDMGLAQPDPETTRLEIQADGNWSVTLLPLIYLTQVTSGTGDSVIFLPAPMNPAWISHTGASNFIVWAKGSAFGPEYWDLVVNTIGNYSGQRPLHGRLVVIQADGAWSFHT